MKKSNLVHYISKNDKKANVKIKIRLGDPCRNGHEDFAITADFWTVGKPRTERNFEMAGCCHEEILKLFPELQIFVDLHLSDWNGIPMHAGANGFYYLVTQKERETGKKYLRITDKEAQELERSADTLHFILKLEKLGILSRWKEEANNAIALLEKMTGETFEGKATRDQLGVTPEQVQEAKTREKIGYYSPEQVQERREEKTKAARAKILLKIEEDYQKKIERAALVKNASLAVIDFFGPLFTNYIVYGHTGEVNLNWKGWEEKATGQQIQEFKNKHVNFTVKIDGK